MLTTILWCLIIPVFRGVALIHPGSHRGDFKQDPSDSNVLFPQGEKALCSRPSSLQWVGWSRCIPMSSSGAIYLFRTGDDANVWKIEYESCERENIWVLGPSKCQFHTVQSHVYQEGSLMFQVSGPDIRNPSQRFFIFSGSQTFLRRHSFQGKIHSHLLKCHKCYRGGLLRPPGDPWGLADNI